MLARACRISAHRHHTLSRHISVEACHQAIASKNASVNALVHTAIETSVAAQGDSLALQDLAVAVKDNFCTVSMPTTCSSKMLEGFTSPFDATAVQALRRVGAHIVGKSNCDEFGMGSLNIHSIHGAVVNPHQVRTSISPWHERERRSAGGSSGGSAAAVAAGMCDAALATDTGGSTRLPASYCGVVGLKPSYGLISRSGVISYADSLDCVGLIAKDVATTRRVFDVLSFHDPKDPTAAKPETRDQASEAVKERLNLSKDIAHLRVGVPHEYFPSESSPSVLAPLRRVLSDLRALGVTIVPVSLPSTAYALSAYYVIASAEASSNMARYDGVQYGMRVTPSPDADRTTPSRVYAQTRSRGFGNEVKKRILLGTYALTADAFDNYFLQAQRVRKRVREDFRRVFRMRDVLARQSDSPCTPPGAIDVLLHPSAIRTAPALPETACDSSASPSSGLEAYVQDVLTVPASLAGLPALNVPAGLADDGWPVGVSVVGQWGSEPLVLRVGEVVEALVKRDARGDAGLFRS